MPRSLRVGRFGWALLAALLALAAGCGRAAREWRADDHDQEPGSGQGAPGGAGGGDELAAIIDSSWQAKCAKCHGMSGRGDGPSGPKAGAQDLTSAKFQDGRTDEQMASSIVNGKGRMPAFGDVPPEILGGLVAKVRSFRAR